MRGFTLVELLVVVAILGILSAIGIPMYIGYVDNSRAVVAQNSLRSIYVQQQEYFSDNSAYYSTGATCNDSSAAINNNLFDGRQVLDNTYYDFCILQATTADFQARAVKKSGGQTFTVDQNNNVNF